MIKVFLLVPLFFFLALFQTSFLVHFPIFGIVPNVIIIVFVLFHLSKALRSRIGLASAVIGGLFLDVFSGAPFGFWVVILIAASFTIEIVMNQYVRTPIV